MFDCMSPEDLEYFMGKLTEFLVSFFDEMYLTTTAFFLHAFYISLFIGLVVSIIVLIGMVFYEVPKRIKTALNQKTSVWKPVFFGIGIVFYNLIVCTVAAMPFVLFFAYIRALPLFASLLLLFLYPCLFVLFLVISYWRVILFFCIASALGGTSVYTATRKIKSLGSYEAQMIRDQDRSTNNPFHNHND